MCFLFFFFSSRRRHTRCALVTGVQTCALPIWRPAHIHLSLFGPSFATRLVTQLYFPGDPLLAFDPIHNAVTAGARERLISRFSLDATAPAYALGYEFDIVLRGRSRTPFEG